MMERSEKVFVTGANGHVGNNLVKALLERGYKVRASVRDASDPEKTRLLPTGDIELVSLDVRDAELFAQASEGVDILFHVAATYKNYTSSKQEDDEMRSDAIEGARAAVMAAARNRIPRMVLTSSAVTIPMVPRGGPATTEAEWRTDFTLPYHEAKTVAEQEAWKLAKEHGVNMVSVLPGAILGPGFSRGTSSTNGIESIMLGGLKNGTPNANFPAVDIRDVIDGHIRAAESSATGRFIIVNDHLPTLEELGRLAHSIDPSIPPPGKVLPDFVMTLGPFFDWLNHKTLGAPRTVGSEFIAAVKGKEWTMSNARAKRELGWSQRIPLEQSVADTIATLRQLRSLAKPSQPAVAAKAGA
jgi:dihydroflavonol-4-reductase